MEPIDASLLGAGWIVARAYAPSLAAPCGLRVRAVYDPDRVQARAVAERLDARVVDTVEAALSGAAHAALVCAPADAHADLVARALGAGRFVLCEKPVARNVDELTAALARGGADRFMGVAVMRMRADVRKLLDWVRAGRVGTPRRIRLEWTRENGVPRAGSWRTRRAHAPTGVLEDLGPHLLDIALAMLRGAGSATGLASCCAVLRCEHGARAAASADWIDGGPADAYDAPDRCAAELRTGAGCAIELHLAWSGVRGDQVSIEVQGDRGRAGFVGLFGFSTHRRNDRQECWLETPEGTEVERFPTGAGPQEEAFSAMVRRFADFCAARAEPLSSADEVASVTAWMEAIAQAARSGS